MSKSIVIHLDGDISVEVAGHVSSLLGRRRPDLKLEIGELSSEAHLTLTPDDIAIAAALSAVLSFLLEAYKTWHERKEQKKAARQPKKISLRDALNQEIKSFGAEGFEIKDLGDLNQSTFEQARETTIVLEDVPNKQIFEVKMTVGYYVKIRRRENHH